MNKILPLLLLAGCRALPPAPSSLPAGSPEEPPCRDREAFTYELASRVPSASMVGALAGDIDEDGVVDLATSQDAASYYDVVVASGRGDATFDAPLPVAPSQGYPVVLTDVTRDGHLDFLVHTEGQIHLFAGDGSGGFSDRAYIDSHPYGGMFPGDFDGDGAADLVWLTQDKVLAVLDLAGEMGARATLSADGDPHEVGIADLDGDGRDELVVGYDETLRVYAWDGAWGLRQELVTLGLHWPMVGLGDIDGDGAIDLVTGAYYFTDGLVVARGDADGRFGEPGVYNYDSTQVIRLVPADLDGDCVDEVVVLTEDLGVRVESVGDSGLERRAEAAGDGAYWVAVEDFDGDGRRDLAFDVGHAGLDVWRYVEETR